MCRIVIITTFFHRQIHALSTLLQSLLQGWAGQLFPKILKDSEQHQEIGIDW